jgi:uncharacterized protein (TIGR02118 family)
MIKMVVINFRKAGMSPEDFSKHWKGAHGALVRKHAKAMGFKKYVQSHVLPSPDIEAFAKARGWAAPPDGITEVWWESVEAMQAALGSAQGQAASAELAKDEPTFIDGGRLSAFLSTEHVVFDFTT